MIFINKGIIVTPQDILRLAEVAKQMQNSPALKAIQDSPLFKELEKQLAPMKEELLKSFTQPQTEQVKDPLPELIQLFRDSVFSHFVHTKSGEIYVLVGLSNEKSDDQEKFPVTAVYGNVKTKECWSRPLIDFAQKFQKLQ